MKGTRQYQSVIMIAALAALLITGNLSRTPAQVRVSPPPDQRPKARVLYPQTSFDKQTALAALGRGRATIRGTACVYKDKLLFRAPRLRISLFPVTPYFEEWHRLRAREEDKQTFVYMSAEAYQHRIDTVTDANGNFQFTELKPGRYFLHAIFEFDQVKTGSVYTGSGYGTDGSRTDYYREQDYRVFRSNRLEKTVEIRQDAETVSTDLKKGWGGILSKGCSRLGD